MKVSQTASSLVWLSSANNMLFVMVTGAFDTWIASNISAALVYTNDMYLENNVYWKLKLKYEHREFLNLILRHFTVQFQACLWLTYQKFSLSAGLPNLSQHWYIIIEWCLSIQLAKLWVPVLDRLLVSIILILTHACKNSAQWNITVTYRFKGNKFKLRIVSLRCSKNSASKSLKLCVHLSLYEVLALVLLSAKSITLIAYDILFYSDRFWLPHH